METKAKRLFAELARDHYKTIITLRNALIDNDINCDGYIKTVISDTLLEFLNSVHHHDDEEICTLEDKLRIAKKIVDAIGEQLADAISNDHYNSTTKNRCNHTKH
jgi:hypothetical protein